MLLVLSIEAVYPKTYAQKILLSLDMHDVSIRDLLTVLEEKSEFVFLYADEITPLLEKKIDVKVKNATLSMVLTDALKNTDLHYKLNDTQVSLVRKDKAKVISVEEIVQAQKRFVVNGKVIDANKEALIGVSIKIKGTTRGTVSNMDGAFEIEVQLGDLLEFTYMGFASRSYKVENTKDILIQMQEKMEEIDDVVVVGYATQKKISLTGAISNIKGDDILTTKNPSLAVALAGKVPGLQIRQQSGMPGEFNTSINVRGMGSPLYVIDGVVRDGGAEFQRINPEDIESVTVLKDASAAIYGINSSNGVIIVKTKSGKEGPMRITYSGMAGLSSPTTHVDMFNVRQYEEIRNEAEVNVGRAPIYSSRESLNMAAGKPYVNWYDEVFKKAAFQQQHNLTLEGGSDKLSTFISAGYVTDNGLLKSGDIGYEKFSLRSNVKFDVSKNFSAALNVSGWTDKRKQPGTDPGAYFFLAKSAHSVIPSETVYANNNTDYFNKPAPLGENPVAASDRDLFGYTEWRNRMLQTSLDLTYKVPYIKGLSLRLLGAYDYRSAGNTRVQKALKLYNYLQTDDSGEYQPSTLGDPFIQEETSNFTRVDLQTHIAYNNKIGDDHSIGAVLVFEAKEENERYLSGKRYYDFFTTDIIDRAPVNGQETGGWTLKRTYLSYIGRLNYNFREKYLLELAFRYDGSYRYEPDQRWGFFPVVSAGWRISEEKFIKEKLPFITNLKLRASYGKTGQDEGDAFQYVPGYASSGGYVFDERTYTNGYGRTALMNDKLTWNTARTADIGFDLSFKNGLFDVEFDVYRRDRSGLLGRKYGSLPNTFGATLPEENLNKDRTEGFELTLGHRNHIGKVEYGIRGNINIGRTKVIYSENAPFTSSWDKYRNGVLGRWNDIGWGYNVIGQAQNFDDIRNLKHIQTGDRANSAMLPGDYIHQDVNGDGLIDAKDERPMFWNGEPKLHFGFTMDAKWNGFDIFMLWQGSALNSAAYNEVLGGVLAFGGNSPEFYYDRWHLEDVYNSDSKWVEGYWPATRANSYDQGSNLYKSNANQFSSFYLRLKSIELGYTLPAKFLKTKNIKNMRLFVNGYNLLVFCDKYLKNVDPEIGNNNGYGFNYPLSVSYNLGVNITF